ncbi:MAG: hypothetical protein Phog2KO_29990 [Phototrophicaceae bacterium]
MTRSIAIILIIGFIFINLLYQPAPIQADENLSNTSVVLVIDTSGSMWGTPINSVKDAATNFVLNMDETVPIAIATFANQAELVQEYTTNKVRLLQAINDLTPDGVTALYDGAMLGVDYASQSNAANRVVILLSDGGEYGEQSQASRHDAILYAQSQNILVYSIGLGFGADRSYLEDIATQTNGVFYTAELETDVTAIYDELGTELSALIAEPAVDVAEFSAPSVLAPISVTTNNSYSVITDTDIVQQSPDGEDPDQPTQNIIIIPVSPNTAADTATEPETDATPSDTSASDTDATPSDTSASDTDATTSNTTDTVAISGQDTAIVLTIDVSQSMWGTPMNSTIEAIQGFILDVDDSIPIAIVTFSNSAQLIQDFTTDKGTLLQVVGDIVPYGVTALYDGALLSVEVAAESGASNPVVLLLSDGGEYGGQSDSGREDAMLIAAALDVTVNTIGFGFGVDRTYLESLSTLTNGNLYEVDNREALLDVYSDLSGQFDANTVVEVVDSANPNAITPLTTDSVIEPTGLGSIQSEFPLGVAPELEDIAPLDNEIAALNLNTQSTNNIDPVVEDSVEDTAEEGSIAPNALEEVEADPISNIMPVTVTVTDDIDIEAASIYINSYEIAAFTEAPFTFDLDTNLLTTGLYNLVVEVRTSTGVTSEGLIPFEVELVSIEPVVASSAVDANNDSTNTTSIEPIIETTAPGIEERILTINGLEQPFDFEYSLVTGLTLSSPTVTTEELAASQNLAEILSRPLQIIPQPVVDYVTIPRPRLVTGIIIVMTLILLPQGLFTIYWMTYTWVSPERIEKSSSPKEFYEPQTSFTSLLPARKEAAVIYDTIKTINRINYPEELKETLILIRDEDDDETIAATKRAIEDIRQSYFDNGEEYPDNVHLVTFTDGPYNKPNGLNRGYAASTKEVICIFDAEDQPHPDIYNVVNTVIIRDSADVVQSGVQLMNFKSNWFSAFNVLEYFFWFKSGLHAYTHELNVTPLGGNTVFFKKTWLDIFAKEDLEDGYRVWDEQGLTEDGDIGIRLTQMGANIQIVYDAVQATQEETPDSIEQFVKQRTRWNQGFYQIFAKGVWRELPTLKQRITAIYVLLNSLLQASIMLFLPVGVFIAVTQEVPVPIAIISYIPIYILIFQLMLNMIGLREFTDAYGMKIPFLFRLKMLGAFYPYQLMLSFSALRAIGRFLTNQSSWEKTTHSNLHRQSSGSSNAHAGAQ